MAKSHQGIGITEKDWDKSVKLFIKNLDKFNVPQKEKDELVVIVASLKGSIVQQKAE